MSERVHYRIIEDGPGSLLTAPPDIVDVKVFWNEQLSQDDGKGWVAFSRTDLEVRRFFKERAALLWVARHEEHVGDDGV